jgi:hypothetical protein
VNDRGAQLAEMTFQKQRYACFIFLFFSSIFLGNVFIFWHDYWRFYNHPEAIVFCAVTIVLVSGWLITKSQIRTARFPNLKLFENGLYVESLGFIPWKNIVEMKLSRQWIGFLVDFNDKEFLSSLESSIEIDPNKETVFAMNFRYLPLSSNMSSKKFYNLFPQEIRERRVP